MKETLARLRAAGGKVWDELASAGRQGASEIATALYSSNGSGFVQYPREGGATLDGLKAEAKAKAQEAGRGNDGPDAARQRELER